MMIPKPSFKSVKPKRKERGRITKAQYQLALDWFGDTCSYCNGYPVEMHHIHLRSLGGRGNYRNLIPLCKEHHDMAHSSREFNDSLKEDRVEVYGKHYYMDAHDLYFEGLIDEPTAFKFDEFMDKQERSIKNDDR